MSNSSEISSSLRANVVSDQTHRSLVLVGVMLLICEHIGAFSDEIELVWNARRSLGKVSYLTIRYGTWLLVVMPMYESVTTVALDLCSPIMMANTYAVVIGIALTQAVLVVRTWAIWSRARWLLVLLSASLVAVHAAEIVLTSLFFARAQRHVVYEGHGLSLQRHCGVFYNRDLFLRDGLQTPLWVLISTFDFVIMGLTAIKAVQHVRRGSSTLVTTLYRDGLIYFVAVFVISLLYLVLTFALPTSLDVTFTLQIQTYLYAILACRAMLHLRAAAASTTLMETWRSPLTLAFRVSCGVGRDETTAWFGDELGTSSVLVIGFDTIHLENETTTMY